jgi:hypothetical protein
LRSPGPLEDRFVGEILTAGGDRADLIEAVARGAGRSAGLSGSAAPHVRDGILTMRDYRRRRRSRRRPAGGAVRVSSLPHLTHTYLQGATVPLDVTGLPGLPMRFGTSTEGLPINIQVVGSWLAESTILHVASLLETVSTVRGLHPTL